MNENKWILRKDYEVKTVPADGKIEVVPESVPGAKRYFTVSIKETLEKTVVIAAEDAAHAEEIAEELCNSEEIVLEYDHFSGRTTETIREADATDFDMLSVYNEDEYEDEEEDEGAEEDDDENEPSCTGVTLKDIADAMTEDGDGASEAVRMFKRILSMLPDQPRSFDTSDDPGYWTNGAEILCPTETECEIVADFLEDLFKGYGDIKMHTGYYDPDEDRRSGEMDDNTGFYYIDFNN